MEQWDASEEIINNNRATAGSFFTKGKIHVLVAAQNSRDSVEFIEGQFKDIDPDNKPFYRLVFLTHSDKEEDDGAIDYCKGLCKECKLYQVDAIHNRETIVNAFIDLLKIAVVEHEDEYAKCVTAVGKKPKKPTDGDKSNGNGGNTGCKCVLL